MFQLSGFYCNMRCSIAVLSDSKSMRIPGLLGLTVVADASGV